MNTPYTNTMKDETPTAGRMLKSALEKIQRENPRYSLRAFSKKLGLSPSGLAQILSGKKRLSTDRAYSIAGTLRLPEKERELFLLVVELERAKLSKRRAEVFGLIKKRFSGSDSNYFDLSVEEFELLSDWFGLAILECVSSYGASYDSSKIAKHLGITALQASQVLERLGRLGLITQNEKGKWARTKSRLLVSSSKSSEAIQAYYKSVQSKTTDSITKQTPQEKVSGAEVFAFDQDDLKEIKEATDDYLERLQSIARKCRKPRSIYQAIVHVFQLTEKTV